MVLLSHKDRPHAPFRTLFCQCFLPLVLADLIAWDVPVPPVFDAQATSCYESAEPMCLCMLPCFPAPR